MHKKFLVAIIFMILCQRVEAAHWNKDLKNAVQQNYGHDDWSADLKDLIEKGKIKLEKREDGYEVMKLNRAFVDGMGPLEAIGLTAGIIVGSGSFGAGIAMKDSYLIGSGLFIMMVCGILADKNEQDRYDDKMKALAVANSALETLCVRDYHNQDNK